MAEVASEPDDYDHTTAGSFSYDYHFIDAEDDPTTSCSVDYDRDCEDGDCVVGAIANYVSCISFRWFDGCG